MPDSDTFNTVSFPNQKIIILVFKGMKTATNIIWFLVQNADAGMSQFEQ
jgi:hypothetical protein